MNVKKEYIICEITSAPKLVTVNSKETKIRKLSLKQLGDKNILNDILTNYRNPFRIL